MSKSLVRIVCQPLKKSDVIKNVIIITCVLLVAAAPLPADEPVTQRDYYAVMVRGQKIGHMIRERTVTGPKVISREMITTLVSRNGTQIEWVIDKTLEETLDGRPLGFTDVSRISNEVTRTTGVLDDEGRMTVTQEVGGQKKTYVVDYPKGALMPEGERLAAKKHDWKPGSTFRVKRFSPHSATPQVSVFTVGEKEKIDLLGRVVEATPITQEIHLSRGVATEVRHVDEQGQLLRLEGPYAHTRVAFIKCDKAFALSKVTTTEDFFASSYITCPKPLPVIAKRIILTLKPREGREVTIPETDAQKVEVGFDGTITVTIQRLAMQAGQAVPFEGSNAGAVEATRPARFVQSDDELIVEAARKAVGNTRDAVKVVRKLAAWVNKRVSSKNLSVGYASASEVIRSREGDCTEHSVLLAAMCRAVGVPARTAYGMLYVRRLGTRKDVFGGHQWTQVYVSGKWIDIDATLRPPYYSIGRITLGTGLGNESEWSALLGKFGSFEIADVKVVK